MSSVFFRFILRCSFLLFIWFSVEIKQIPDWWITVLLRPSENKRLEISYICATWYLIFCFLIRLQHHCLGAVGLAASQIRVLQSAPGALTLAGWFWGSWINTNQSSSNSQPEVSQVFHTWFGKIWWPHHLPQQAVLCMHWSQVVCTCK